MKILVVGRTAPLLDRSSADLRLWELLKIFAAEMEVHFVATDHAMKNREEKIDKNHVYYAVRNGNFRHNRFEFVEDYYFAELARIGVRALNPERPRLTIRPTDTFDLRPYLTEKYDAVWVQHFYKADQFLSAIRRMQPWATLCVDAVELHYRRLESQARHLENRVSFLVNARHEKKSLGPEHAQKIRDHHCYAQRVKQDEIATYRRADLVVVSSAQDGEALRVELPLTKIWFRPNLLEALSSPPPFVGRRGSVFLGNFDNHANVSGALYLKHEVAPAAAAAGTLPRFTIVGNNPHYLIKTIATKGEHAGAFKVVGQKTDLALLDQANSLAAPVLFGAGWPGKIGSALARGLPVVTTPLGASSAGLQHERHCLVADSAVDFAAALGRLEKDATLWLYLQREGQALVRDRHAPSPEVAAEFRALVNVKKIRAHQAKPIRWRPSALELAAPKFPRAPKPLITVILLTFNEWRVTDLCLRSLSHSITAHPELPVEVLVVDNASTDGTREHLQKIKNISLLLNKKNLGFSAGNNAGIKVAKGEHIILLNNDTVMPPDGISLLYRHYLSIPDLGILGPSANTETGQTIAGTQYHSLGEFFAFNEKIQAENKGAWESVQKISGLCMFLPRRTIEEVGLLDPGYGIGYFEDDDYCLRTADHGLKVVCAKDVMLHHFGSMSFEGNSINRQKHMDKGMNRFVFKWGNRGLRYLAEIHQNTLVQKKEQEYF